MNLVDYFNVNLCAALSHSVMYFSKEEYSPNGVVDDAQNNSDPAAPSNQQMTGAEVASYQKALPTVLGASNSQILPAGQALQNAQNSLAPQQAQLLQNLFQTYAPQLLGTGIGLQNTQQNAAIQQQNQLTGSGGAGTTSVQNAIALDKMANPEAYATKAAGASSLANLLQGSQDISGKLTGGEQAAVERAANQSDASRGIANTPSQTATLSNAMNFGNAVFQKSQAEKSNLANAIGAATSFIPAATSGVNSWGIATGSNNPNSTVGSNPGLSQFGGTPSSTLGTANSNVQGTAGNVLDLTGQNEQTMAGINANRRDSLDRVTQVMGSMPSISA